MSQQQPPLILDANLSQKHQLPPQKLTPEQIIAGQSLALTALEQAYSVILTEFIQLAQHTCPKVDLPKEVEDLRKTVKERDEELAKLRAELVTEKSYRQSLLHAAAYEKDRKRAMKYLDTIDDT